MADTSPEAPHVVIVGGGLAGWRAAEELRAAGFDGPLTLLSEEPHAPYDRPPLSKRLLKAGEKAEPFHFAREESNETSLRLDLRQGVRAVGIKPGAVLTEQLGLDGSRTSGELAYDALIVATGVRARELPALHGHPRVHLLRTFDDVLALRPALDEAKTLLVVGAGFIGAEVATAAYDRGIAVTVVEALPVPYQRSLGEVFGGIVGRLAVRYGVDLRTGTGVAELMDSPGSVHVRLADGSELEADLAVVGIGTQLNVEWLEAVGAGWEQGVTCDGAGRAVGRGVGAGQEWGRVYALGDVAAWHDEAHDSHTRFEHWTTAVDQAPVMARALLSDFGGHPGEPPAPLVPYFWSDQYGRKVQLLGRPGLADSVVLLHGDEPADPHAPAPRKVLVGYFCGDRLVAVAGISAAGLLGRYRPLLAEEATRERVMAYAEELGGRAAAS
jgi:NADPH-dependent 2,4-dienoyl-CoA reductase/sulfur reductase-like enzyme